MSLCPKTLQPCCDDICHGSGCLEMGGASMVEKCVHCGAFYQDHEECDCDDQEEYDY